jgi:hypothetical protein
MLRMKYTMVKIITIIINFLHKITKPRVYISSTVNPLTALVPIGRNQISASQAALGKISSAGRRIGFLGYSRAVSCLM